MSKMDGLRAMREARYERDRVRGSKPGAAGPTAASARAKPPMAPRADEQPAAAPSEAPEEAVCGHRNMTGRTCTREQGHAAKSHRYS